MSVPLISKRVLQVPRGRHSASLETSRNISENVTFSPVPAGSVGHLDANKEWASGLPNVANVAYVPLILFQHSDDPDVRPRDDIDPDTEPMAYVSGVDSDLDSSGNAVPHGPLMLIGLDAFIIESARFDSGQSYPPGTPLTATAADTNAVTGGRLTPTTVKTLPICGIVLDGVKTNLEKTQLLSWVTWFFPKLT